MGKAIIQCTPAYLAGKEKPYFAVSVTHAELSRSVRIAHGKSNLDPTSAAYHAMNCEEV